MGKISSSWKSNMVMAPAEIAASAAMMGRILARESRIDRRRNPVNRVRLFDYWRVIELGGRRVDMPAGCDHERDVLLAKARGDGPHVLALEVHVEDGEVEPAFFDLVEGASDIVARIAHRVTE